MNTSWFAEYLSDEWFGWDISTFKKYQLTEKDIFFGWWLTGDIQAFEGTINEVFKLITYAKNGEAGEFLGNSFEMMLTQDTVYLMRSSTKEQYQYPLELFEEALLEWEFINNQSKEK